MTSMAPLAPLSSLSRSDWMSPTTRPCSPGAGCRALPPSGCANADRSRTFDKDNRTGFVGGTFVYLGLGPLGFQPELSYSRVGFSRTNFSQTS